MGFLQLRDLENIIMKMLLEFQEVRFVLRGGLSLIFVYSLNALFVWRGFSPSVSWLGSSIIGVIFNCQSSRRLDFNNAESSFKRDVVVYVIIVIMYLFVICQRKWYFPSLHLSG